MDMTAMSRINLLRMEMLEHGYDAFVLRDVPSITWLTSFSGVFDGERAHTLLITPEGATLHTDSRYANACRLAAEHCGLVEIDDTPASSADFVGNCLESIFGLQSSKALAIEDDIALRDYMLLEDHAARIGFRLVVTGGVMAHLRSIKQSDELACLQKAADIADAAFSHIVEYAKVGMSEARIRQELEGYMLSHGADGLSFPSIVATGPNGANPHAIPGEAVLEPGQCVVLDFGCVYHGYCSDMTRMLFVGKPDELVARAYEAIRDANEQVTAMIKPGLTGISAHQTACDILRDHGFEGRMGHGLGHGVGMEVHEQPNLNGKNDKGLEAGNVVTVEPGIYLAAGDELLQTNGTEGEIHEAFGMRLEDFGVVTADGFYVFSHSTHEMVIL